MVTERFSIVKEGLFAQDRTEVFPVQWVWEPIVPQISDSGGENEYEDCEYASVAETVGELSLARYAEAVRRSTYDAYAKRQREKMKELNEQIEAIYAEGSETG